MSRRRALLMAAVLGGGGSIPQEGLVFSANEFNHARKNFDGVSCNGGLTLSYYSGDYGSWGDLIGVDLEYGVAMTVQNRGNLEVETWEGSEYIGWHFDDYYHHFVIIGTEDYIDVYVDGVMVGSAWGRGFYKERTLSEIFSNVEASRVRVWNRALTQDEVALVYKADGRG